jgi:hypothetical protein
MYLPRSAALGPARGGPFPETRLELGLEFLGVDEFLAGFAPGHRGVRSRRTVPRPAGQHETLT